MIKMMGRLAPLLVGAALAFAVACGGSSSDPTATTAAPTATTAAPTATTAAPTATPVPPTPTSAPAPTATTASSGGGGDDALLAQGKVIFEETGGAVGCAYCHGIDGKGDGPAGLGAPANRGATRDRLEWALGGGETDAMSYIKLTAGEKDAVLAYLAFLGTQP